MNQKIICRKEAIKLNLKYYFTGKFCKNGHLALIYTKTGVCLGCNKASSKRGRNRNTKPEANLQNRLNIYKRNGIPIITDLTIAEMLKLKSKGCAICGTKENSISKFDLCMDHCHITGKFRGFLCKNCNSGIGFFKDSAILLKSAIVYLKNAPFL